jgi:hypothetical protein
MSKPIVDSLIKNINYRFPRSKIVSSFINSFNPKEIQNSYINENLMKNQSTIHAKLTKFFRNRFTEYQYKQKFVDFNLFQSIICSNVNNLKTCSDVCKYILQHHQFAPATTIIRLAQVFLLIPGSSSCVESAFSVLNDIHSKKRNRLGSSILNFLMISKMKISESTKTTLLKRAAKNWLEGEKKRKGLNIIYLYFFEEGLISQIPKTKKLFWKNKEKEKVVNNNLNDEQRFSALMLLKKREEGFDEFNRNDLIDEETVSEFSEDENIEKQQNKRKISKKSKKPKNSLKRKRELFENEDELEVVKMAQELKKFKYANK